jgi:hypothetical protein
MGGFLSIMADKCCLCDEEIQEDFGKIKGTRIKIVEDKKKRLVYVCSACMKKNRDYIAKAKVKEA